MYREAGDLPYGPLRKRIGLLWRILAVGMGSAMALVGFGMVIVVLLALLGQHSLRGAELFFIPGSVPMFGGLAAYGFDFARRAIIVRSTDRSAFEGRVGRTRALLGVAYGGFLLLYAAGFFAMVTSDGHSIDNGLAVMATTIALAGLCVVIPSVRGLTRKRAPNVAPPPLPMPAPLRVAEASSAPSNANAIEAHALESQAIDETTEAEGGAPARRIG